MCVNNTPIRRTFAHPPPKSLYYRQHILNMGIPSYFSYIIRNHSNIIRNLHFMENIGKVSFHSLYMDCNSIIYDAVRAVEQLPPEQNESSAFSFEDKVIKRVILSIKQYISIIRPTHHLYIAFDGVAPFAKMEQQRTRRYKTSFMASLDFEQNIRYTSTQVKQNTNKWNTASITPGTAFMEHLSSSIHYAFSDPLYLERVNVKNVVVSPSTDPGEGEHKMFEYLRNHTQKYENVAVYGLDSDLIMLSIFHCFYCRNIYIFREAPSFSKSVLPPQLRNSDNDILFLNIHKLSQHILEEMGCKVFSKKRVYDYVFLCFLLGNDFLPHFPALNLRTKGIYVLLDMYAKYIGCHHDRSFIDENTLRIQWRWLHLFITECAKSEHTFILEEYEGRKQVQTKCALSLKTSEDRANVFDNIPILMRGEELYMCPEERGWEERYYKVAFHAERTPAFLNELCVNYLEGLEWVFKYYTMGCPHWRWKYNYHYAPLLCDLAKYIPLHQKDFILSDVGKNRPFHPHIQLAYVIPKIQHSLLPAKIQQKMVKYGALFPELEDLEFQWLGCRYFWEAHPILPKIHMDMLEVWEKDLLSGN